MKRKVKKRHDYQKPPLEVPNTPLSYAVAMWDSSITSTWDPIYSLESSSKVYFVGTIFLTELSRVHGKNLMSRYHPHCHWCLMFSSQRVIRDIFLYKCQVHISPRNLRCGTLQLEISYGKISYLFKNYWLRVQNLKLSFVPHNSHESFKGGRFPHS